MTSARDRHAALGEIAALAKAHGLGAAEIAAAVEAEVTGATASSATASSASEARKSGVLTTVFAYLGAVFVFAGIAIFAGMQWPDMNSPARVIATLGSGLAIFGMAFAAMKDARFARTVTPLLLMAAVLEPVGILVAIDEYSSGGDWRHAFLATSGAMLAQQLTTFFVTKRTSVLFTSVVFGAGFFSTAMDLAGADAGLTALVAGSSLLILAVGLDKTAHATMNPFWHFVGSGTSLAGLFDLVSDTAVEPVFLGGACGMVYLSTYLRSRPTLVVATIAILGYVGYFTERHFVDAVGWPLALVAFGLAMLGLSAAALRISRRYIAAGQ